MHSLVIGELFRELPAHGVVVSPVQLPRGRGQRRRMGRRPRRTRRRRGRDRRDGDARSAARHRCSCSPAGRSAPTWRCRPTTLASSAGSRSRRRCYYAAEPDGVGLDPRPKHLVLGQRDQVRKPDDVRAATAHWNATTVEVVDGADHFFLGRTDRVVAAARDFIARLIETDA